MGRLFSVDGKVYQFLTLAMNLIVTNVLFLICCIPIVTIGASFSAMYSITLQLADKEEPHIIGTFFHHFFDNLKNATIIWLSLVAVVLTLIINFRGISWIGNQWLYMLKWVVYIVAVFISFISTYIFAMIAKFKKTPKEYCGFACLISVKYLPYSILFILIDVLPVTILLILSTFNSYALLLLLMLGCSLPAYWKSGFLLKIFERYVTM